LANGVVRIAGEKIAAVSPCGEERANVDLGNVAILPGLVNAHTHLDLSGMRGVAPPSPDFVGWLRQVISHRRTVSPEQSAADIRAGLAECLRFGTTLVGDIASGGASWDALSRAMLRSVVFWELIGLTPERAENAWANAEAWLRSRGRATRCRPGLSPHAPYSVQDQLLFKSVMMAKTETIPLAMHLAETIAERQLLEDQSGPFVAFLRDLGVWNPDGLLTSVEEVPFMCSGYGLSEPLLIHANFLDPNMTSLWCKGTVVYCPRTHAAFGHPPHPFREFFAKGVRVALGTDSLASNPDLDILAEARFVRARYPDVPGDVLLRMITLSGAEALGWADECGSIAPGKSADLVVLPLPNREAADPHDLVFDSEHAVEKVLWRGQWRRSHRHAPAS